MVVLIAGRIFTAYHVHYIVFHLLRAAGCYITFPLLGDHIRNISFPGSKVIAHRLRFILLVAVLKQRVTELLTDRVETEFGEYQTTVHIHLDHFSLQSDLLVFYITFTVQISPVTGSHDNRVLCLISNRRVETGLFFRNGIRSQCRTVSCDRNYRIPHNSQHSIRRGNQLLRIHHQSPGEEI